MWLDFLLILFGISIAAECRRTSIVRSDYLSRNNTSRLRGILAITIVLHHISENISRGGLLFHQLVHCGYLVVAMFFFLSGYGCLRSYKKKRREYLKGFWKRRILYLFIIYALISVSYLLYYKIMGEDVVVLDLFESLFNGNPIAMNSWYIIVQLFMYIAFYFAYKLPFKKNWTHFVLVFFQLSLMAFVFELAHYNPVWYISNFAFVLGIIYADKKSVFDHMLEKRWIFLALISFAAFAFFSALPLQVNNYALFSSDVLSVRSISRYISSICFVALLICFLYKIRIIGRFWEAMGKLSLEIYLLHGLVYSFFRSSICYVKNDVLWTMIVLVVSVLIAIPAHKVSRLIADLLNK